MRVKRDESKKTLTPSNINILNNHFDLCVEGAGQPTAGIHSKSRKAIKVHVVEKQ